MLSATYYTYMYLYIAINGAAQGLGFYSLRARNHYTL
jgi:hypothetical protein